MKTIRLLSATTFAAVCLFALAQAQAPKKEAAKPASPPKEQCCVEAAKGTKMCDGTACAKCASKDAKMCDGAACAKCATKGAQPCEKCAAEKARKEKSAKK